MADIINPRLNQRIKNGNIGAVDVVEATKKGVKIVDSHHDFKLQDRTPSLHAELAPYVQTFLGKSQETFFKEMKIAPTSPEQTGKLAYEKLLPRILDSSETIGNIPTIVKYSEFSNILEKIKNVKSIQLEQDDAFKYMDVANFATVGLHLLKWFYPTAKENGNKAYFNFDAAQTFVRDIMGPLTNPSKPFVAYQLVDPQNILDSAKTSFYIFYDTHGKGTFNMIEGKGRTEYPENFLGEEYSNLFTSDVGQFIIKSGGFGEKNKYSIQYFFKFTDGREIPIVVGGKKINGPSVAFLSALILTIKKFLKNTKGNYKLDDTEWRKCWEKLQEIEQNNDDVISPLGLIKEFQNRGIFNRIIDVLFDFKRLGDHEQANGVYYYTNKTTSGGSKTQIGGDLVKNAMVIFVTHDILSALYSRIIGNHTIYTDTYNNCLLCYKGDVVVDEKETLLNNIDNMITSLNYFFYLQTMLQALLAGNEDSDLFTLIANLRDNIDFSYPDTPDKDLKNILLRSKVLNALFFFQGIHKQANIVKDSMVKALHSITDLGIEINDIHGTNVVFNRTVFGTKPASELEPLRIRLTDLIDGIKADAGKASESLDNFNMFKIPGSTDYPIFSFQNKLYFDSSIAKSLDVIKFKESNIVDIVAKTKSLGRGPRANRIENEKRSLIDSCRTYLENFFTTDAFSKEKKEKTIEDFIINIPALPSDIENYVKHFFNSLVDIYNDKVCYRNGVGQEIWYTSFSGNHDWILPDGFLLVKAPTKRIEGRPTMSRPAVIPPAEIPLPAPPINYETKIAAISGAKPANNAVDRPPLKLKFKRSVVANLTKGFLKQDDVVPTNSVAKTGGMRGINSLFGELFEKTTNAIISIYKEFPGSLVFVPGIGYNQEQNETIVRNNTMRRTNVSFNMNRTRKLREGWLQKLIPNTLTQIKQFSDRATYYLKEARLLPNTNITERLVAAEQALNAIYQRIRKISANIQNRLPNEEEKVEIMGLITKSRNVDANVVSLYNTILKTTPQTRTLITEKPKKLEYVMNPQYQTAGDYSPIIKDGYFISEYDIFQQCKLLQDEIVKYKYIIKDALDATDTELSKDTKESLKDTILSDWFNFKASLDTLGTPDFLAVNSIDVRTLNLYVEFEKNISDCIDGPRENQSKLEELHTNYNRVCTNALVYDEKTINKDEANRILTNNLKMYLQNLEKHVHNFMKDTDGVNLQFYFHNILLNVSNVFNVYKIFKVLKQNTDVTTKINILLNNDRINVLENGSNAPIRIDALPQDIGNYSLAYKYMSMLLGDAGGIQAFITHLQNALKTEPIQSIRETPFVEQIIVPKRTFCGGKTRKSRKPKRSKTYTNQ